MKKIATQIKAKGYPAMKRLGIPTYPERLAAAGKVRGKMARCKYCKGSGLADKEGPDDDELLSRVVLSAITIDGLHAEIERLRNFIKRCGLESVLTASETERAE